MALTCQWVQIERGHYRSRLNRVWLEIRKVPGEMKYQVLVQDKLVGERTTLNGAKTAAIRVAQGGATYNRRRRTVATHRLFRRHGVDQTAQEASLTYRHHTPEAEHRPHDRPIPQPRRFEDWIKEPDDTTHEEAAPVEMPAQVDPALQPEEPVVADRPNLPALIVEEDEQGETILTFTIQGKVSGGDMVTAVNNLKSAVELLRTFAVAKCSYKIPSKGSL